MHYLPPAVVYATVKRITAGAMTGVGVFALYVASNDASGKIYPFFIKLAVLMIYLEVYGSDLPKTITLVPAVCLGLSLEFLRAYQSRQ